MAFKQGNNPLSRKTSPMRMSPFKKQEPSMSMDELQKMSAAQDAASKAQADKLPQIEKPGFDYEMDQDMSYPGGERGRDYDEEGAKEQIKKEAQIGSKMGQLKDGMSRKESPLNAEGDRKNHKMSNNEYSEHLQSPKGKKDHGAGMSRKEAKYFGLGKDDGTARKTKKADKTAKQVIKMQNKRSSVKNVYLGDPDDLEGEMVRTADKPASKREKRKVKKLKKTKDQLGMSRESSPLNKTKAERRLESTKNKIEDAKKEAGENKSTESNQRNRAKAKRLEKRAKRQEGRAERKATKNDKTLSRGEKRKEIIDSRKKQKAKPKSKKVQTKANRGVRVTSVGTVKSSAVNEDLKASGSDFQDSTRAQVKKSLA